MISIIIVSWQVKNFLKICLSSIYQQEKNSLLEIIVVDNHSTDGTDLMIKTDFPQVKLISLDKNYGFAYAGNRGVEQSIGDYLLFLNPDTKWHQPILREIIKFYNQLDNPGAVGLKILNDDLSLQKWVRKLPTLFSQIIILSKIHIISKKLLKKYLCLDFNYQNNQEIEQVVGAFYFIKKSIFNQLGGFDKKFFIWFEEVDLCQRLLKTNYNNYYFSEKSIIHFGEESFKQISNLKKQIIFNGSLLYYFKKSRPLFEYFLLLLVIPLNLLLTSISQLLRIKPKHYL